MAFIHMNLRSTALMRTVPVNVIIPADKPDFPGILFELKWEKNLEEEDLNLLAEEALQQITTLKYDADMREDGITDILRFGIAFSGKKVRVKTII